MHGGAVSASGQGPGHGTELVVRLPLLGVTSTSFGARRNRPPVMSPRRILVADDNSDAVEALALQLQLAGHDVRTANDGMEALGVAGRCAPGGPARSWHAQNGRLRDRTPDQAPSGGAGRHARGADRLGQQQDRQRTSAAGFDVHLVKPVTEFDLFHAIASARAGQSTSPGPPSSNSRNRGRPRPISGSTRITTWTDSWASYGPCHHPLCAGRNHRRRLCGRRGAAASGASGNGRSGRGGGAAAVPVAVGTVVREVDADRDQRHRLGRADVERGDSRPDDRPVDECQLHRRR